MTRPYGAKKDSQSFQVPENYYISAAFVRQYYRGVTRKESTNLDQCPFYHDTQLEQSHLRSLEELACDIQHLPAESVNMTTLLQDTPVATFLNYIDFSSEKARDERGSQLSLDVSTLSSTKVDRAMYHFFYCCRALSNCCSHFPLWLSTVMHIY